MRTKHNASNGYEECRVPVRAGGEVRSQDCGNGVGDSGYVDHGLAGGYNAIEFVY